jgi:hypothetical protein
VIAVTATHPQPATGSGPHPPRKQPWIARLIIAVVDGPKSLRYALSYLGAIILVGGISSCIFAFPNARKVECDGKQMSPGDTCEQYREPGHQYVGSKSYDDKMADVRQNNLLVAWIGLAIVVILVVVAIVHLTKARRRERAQAHR